MKNLKMEKPAAVTGWYWELSIQAEPALANWECWISEMTSGTVKREY